MWDKSIYPNRRNFYKPSYKYRMRYFQKWLEADEKGLFEVDARRIQSQKAGEAGGQAYGGAAGIASGVSSLAAGNVFALWEVLKSALEAYKGITKTTEALQLLIKTQSIYKKLHKHISSTLGKGIADQYVEAVFDADQGIIPMIPPDSWNDIMRTFVSGLEGGMEDYKNLTFAHAIGAVLERNLSRVQSVISGQASKFDRKLQSLESEHGRGQESPIRSFMQQNQQQQQWTPGEPRFTRGNKNWLGGYKNMDELYDDTKKLIDQWADNNRWERGMLRITDGVRKWWEEERNEAFNLAMKEVGILGNQRLTPQVLLKAAIKAYQKLVEETRQRQKPHGFEGEYHPANDDLLPGEFR